MPGPIDLKTIAEWKALARNIAAQREGFRKTPGDVADFVGEALPALLAEREELLRDAEGRRRTAEEAISLLPDGMTLREMVAERKELLALVREAMNPKPPIGIPADALVMAGCAFCAGMDDQHGPDCRAAAFLGKG